jgi:hypothetical protein
VLAVFEAKPGRITFTEAGKTLVLITYRGTLKYWRSRWN